MQQPTHNDVHKDWKLVLAILHERTGWPWMVDKSNLDLTDGRMESTIQPPRVLMEQLFNAFFVCLYLNTLQPPI